MRTFYDRGWHFAIRPARDGGVVAWAKREPIEADGPLHEPWEHTVHFEFGSTEVGVLCRLMLEVFAL